MATNLTSKQIQSWKKSINTCIVTNLVTSLKKANEDTTQLSKVTSSGQDENNLSYRFNDLAKLTTQASKQLTTFMNSFNTAIDKYISDTTKAEKNAEEKIRKSIDQFAESAAKISKLKM